MANPLGTISSYALSLQQVTGKPQAVRLPERPVETAIAEGARYRHHTSRGDADFRFEPWDPFRGKFSGRVTGWRTEHPGRTLCFWTKSGGQSALLAAGHCPASKALPTAARLPDTKRAFLAPPASTTPVVMSVLIKKYA